MSTKLKPNLQVRWAVPGEETALVQLLRTRHDEEGFGVFDPVSVTDVVSRGIARQWAGIGVLRGPKGIEGSVGLYIARTWDSDVEYLDGMWMFVYEQYRVSDRLQTLVRFAKWAATGLQLPLMMVNVSREPIPFEKRDTEQLRQRLTAAGKSSARFVNDAMHDIWRGSRGATKDVACHRELPRAGSVFMYDPSEPVDHPPIAA